MKTVIMFCGKKSSGKNMLTNFLHGYVLKSLDKIQDFDIIENTGQLLVSAKDEEDKVAQYALNSDSVDETYESWAFQNVWPFIKQYANAYSLKMIAHNIFNIPKENLWGDNEAKSKKIDHLLWENMPISKNEDSLELTESGPMTAREFIQYYGSEVCRSIDPDCWIRDVYNRIKSFDSSLSVVSDGRFVNEVEYLKQKSDINLVSIYLTRTQHSDGHISENSISRENCDYVIDNQNLTIANSCVEVIEVLKNRGLIEC